MSILLASGGIDSLTLRYDMEEHPERYGDEDIVALFFDMKYLPGNQSAKDLLIKLYDKNGWHYRIEEVPVYGGLPLAAHNNPRIGRNWSGKGLDAAVITPFRFLQFYTLASIQARNYNTKLIYTGATIEDGGDLPDGGFADCDVRYIDEFNRHLHIASVDGPPPQIIAPYRDMTKLDVARLAHKLRVPFEYTYSCEFGPDRCNRCKQCILVNGVLATVLGRLPTWRK